jgi:hypothetical protein
MLRVSDQIGYVAMRNNQATIAWYPTDLTVGKNTANLPDAIIPDKSDPKFKTFMTDIITNVKSSIVVQSEAQREAIEKAEKYTKEIKKAKKPEDLSMLIAPVTALPKTLATGLRQLIADRAKEKGWTWNKEAKAFEEPKKEQEPEPVVPGTGIMEEQEQAEELDFN